MQDQNNIVIIVDDNEENIKLIKDAWAETSFYSDVKWHITPLERILDPEEALALAAKIIYLHLPADLPWDLMAELKLFKETYQKNNVPVFTYSDIKIIDINSRIPADDFIKFPLNRFEISIRTQRIFEKRKIMAEMEKSKQKLENSYKRNRIKTINLFGKHNDLKILQKETRQQKEKLLEQHQEISSSIRHASLIQNAVTPSEESLKNIFKEHFILNYPLQIISGDFLWVEKVQNKTYFAVADCTGHGVPGAMMSMMGISLLNSIILRNNNIHVNEMLDELRQQLIKNSHPTSDSDDPGFSMDIGICMIDHKKRKIHFAGANRKLFVARKGLLEVIPGDRMPVGIYPKNEPFTLNKRDIHPNDTFYLFSDGFTDQFGGPDNRKFKISQFITLVKKINTLPLGVQKQDLRDAFQAWKGTQPQVDDVLVLGIRI